MIPKRLGSVKKCASCKLEFWKDDNKEMCGVCIRNTPYTDLTRMILNIRHMKKEPRYDLEEAHTDNCIKDQPDKVALSIFRLVTRTPCCGKIALIPTCGCMYCRWDRVNKRKQKQEKRYQKARFIKEFRKKHSNQPITIYEWRSYR